MKIKKNLNDLVRFEHSGQKVQNKNFDRPEYRFFEFVATPFSTRIFEKNGNQGRYFA